MYEIFSLNDKLQFCPVTRHTETIYLPLKCINSFELLRMSHLKSETKMANLILINN